MNIQKKLLFLLISISYSLLLTTSLSSSDFLSITYLGEQRKKTPLSSLSSEVEKIIIMNVANNDTTSREFSEKSKQALTDFSPPIPEVSGLLGYYITSQEQRTYVISFWMNQHGLYTFRRSQEHEVIAQAFKQVKDGSSSIAICNFKWREFYDVLNPERRQNLLPVIHRLSFSETQHAGK